MIPNSPYKNKKDLDKLDEGFKEFDKIKSEPAFTALAQQEGFIKIMDRVAELSTEGTPQ